MYRAPLARLGPLPSKVDLRAGCPPVYDQRQLGSCTANAIAGALEFDQMKQKLPDVFAPSRLFIYYNERVIEGTVHDDSGAMIRDGIKSVAKQGAPHEELWPYDIAKFRTKPSARAVTDAKKHPAVLYQRVTRDLAQIQRLPGRGVPVRVRVLGLRQLRERHRREDAGTRRCRSRRRSCSAATRCVAVGYDNANKRFIVRNSWGPKWGQKGYFTMPYAYLLDENLSDDFWTIKLVQ